MNARVICLFGPTASGKTAAALGLADRLDGEIINADSRQIYKHLPILSACPDAGEYARARHHLFEILEPDVRTSAGAWAEMAAAAIADVIARGKTPIVVGGTGFYLKTLMGGLDAVPVVPADVEARFAGVPAAELHARLRAVDPVLAEKLLPSDTQRLVRALAVHAHTCEALSAWQKKPAMPLPYDFVPLALCPERAVLHARIAARWGLMREAGVVEEAVAVRAMGFTLGMPGLTGLGVAELWDYADGNIDWDTTTALVTAKTRQYAKRQVTWLRHQYGAVFTGINGATFADEIMGRFV